MCVCLDVYNFIFKALVEHVDKRDGITVATAACCCCIAIAPAQFHLAEWLTPRSVPAEFSIAQMLAILIVLDVCICFERYCQCYL